MIKCIICAGTGKVENINGDSTCHKCQGTGYQDNSAVVPNLISDCCSMLHRDDDEVICPKCLKPCNWVPEPKCKVINLSKNMESSACPNKFSYSMSNPNIKTTEQIVHKAVNDEYQLILEYVFKHGLLDSDDSGISHSQALIDTLNTLVERTNTFLNDIWPQVDKLCIQDYNNLNELAMLLTKLSKANK